MVNNFKHKVNSAFLGVWAEINHLTVLLLSKEG